MVPAVATNNKSATMASGQTTRLRATLRLATNISSPEPLRGFAL
jgi:hypothetical protein